MIRNLKINSLIIFLVVNTIILEYYYPFNLLKPLKLTLNFIDPPKSHLCIPLPLYLINRSQNCLRTSLDIPIFIFTKA